VIRSATDNHVAHQQCPNADRAVGTRWSESQGGQAGTHGVSDDPSRSIDLTRQIAQYGCVDATADDTHTDHDTRERQLRVREMCR
jgi:hypothetical protein